MSQPLTAQQRAARILERQHAAISHAQAVGAGLSDREIAGRIGRGFWRRAVLGVYVLAGSPDTWQQRATVAWLATTAAGGLVSHLTAAAGHQLLRPSFLPHVTIEPGRSPRAQVGRVHRGTVPLIDQCWLLGFRATNVSRTIADIAALLDGPSLGEAIDVAFCEDKATKESVSDAADRAGKGRRGRTRLDRELEIWTPTITPESPGEMRLLRQLSELGVADFVTQHEVYDAAGEFVARLDVAVPRWCVGLEYDGVLFHSPRQWSRDEPRYARLRACGWDVEGVTKHDLVPGRPRLASIVERWIRRQAA